MKQTLKTTFVLLVLALGTFSCRDNENSVGAHDHLSRRAIEVKEGRLNFNKLEDFSQEIINLAKSSKPADYAINLKFRAEGNSTFSSLRKSPKELTTLKVNEADIDTLVQDDLFASFLNDKKE